MFDYFINHDHIEASCPQDVAAVHDQRTSFVSRHRHRKWTTSFRRQDGGYGLELPDQVANSTRREQYNWLIRVWFGVVRPGTGHNDADRSTGGSIHIYTWTSTQHLPVRLHVMCVRLTVGRSVAVKISVTKNQLTAAVRAICKGQCVGRGGVGFETWCPLARRHGPVQFKQIDNCTLQMDRTEPYYPDAR